MYEVHITKLTVLLFEKLHILMKKKMIWQDFFVFFQIFWPSKFKYSKVLIQLEY